MSFADNENIDSIRRTPLSRHNSSLMNVIGIGNKNSNNSSSNLANFTAVTETTNISTTTPTIPTASMTTGSTMGLPRVDSPFQRVDSPFQRTDSPFQPDFGMNPLQRTTSIFNETNNNMANPMTPSAPIAQISTTTTPTTNPDVQGIQGFMPGAPMGPPPGMVGLYISQWKYIDHQGAHQGPFPTDLMSQWYHSNYFQPSLQISIINNNDNSSNGNTAAPPIDPLQLQNKFFTLNDLIIKVGNAIDPFATYDSIVNSFLRGGVNTGPMPPLPMGLPTTIMNPMASSGSNVVSSIHDNIEPLREVQPQTSTGAGGGGQEVATGTKHNIKEGDMEGVVADIHSRDYTFDEILDLSLKDNAYYHQLLVPVPMQRKLKKKIESDTVIGTSTDPRFDNIWSITEIARGHPKPFVPVQTPAVEPMTESVQAQLNKLDINNATEEVIPPPIEEPVETKEKKSTKTEKKGKAEEPAKQAEPTAEEKRKLKADLIAQKLIEEEDAKVRAQEAKEAKALRKVKKQKERKAKKAKSEAAFKSDETDSKPESVEEEASAKSNSKSAAWATKGKSKGRGISLTSFFELQKNEELRQQKLEEQKQLEAKKLSEKILKEEQAKEKNKSMLTWAKSGSSNDFIPNVDIKAQLLKDQEQKKKTKKHSLQESQLSVLNDIPSDPGFIEEQQRIWEQLQKGSKGQKSNGTSVLKKSSIATTTSSTTSSTNAWTTISSKATKKTSTSTIPAKLQPVNKQIKQIGSSTSIPALKTKFVSNIGTISPATVNTRTATPMYPGNSSISKRQEFLKWCKSQLKLNPGISHKSVLEVLLSLPAGPETNEIIADTIYSNSSVMDGRRFAVEFNKKRIECEKQVTDPLSWSEALALPEGNDDDWEFQVVSKKKKGKKF